MASFKLPKIGEGNRERKPSKYGDGGRAVGGEARRAQHKQAVSAKIVAKPGAASRRPANDPPIGDDALPPPGGHPSHLTQLAREKGFKEPENPFERLKRMTEHARSAAQQLTPNTAEQQEEDSEQVSPELVEELFSVKAEIQRPTRSLAERASIRIAARKRLPILRTADRRSDESSSGTDDQSRASGEQHRPGREDSLSSERDGGTGSSLSDGVRGSSGDATGRGDRSEGFERSEDDSSFSEPDRGGHGSNHRSGKAGSAGGNSGAEVTEQLCLFMFGPKKGPKMWEGAQAVLAIELGMKGISNGEDINRTGGEDQSTRLESAELHDGDRRGAGAGEESHQRADRNTDGSTQDGQVSERQAGGQKQPSSSESESNSEEDAGSTRSAGAEHKVDQLLEEGEDRALLIETEGLSVEEEGESSSSLLYDTQSTLYTTQSGSPASEVPSTQTAIVEPLNRTPQAELAQRAARKLTVYTTEQEEDIAGFMGLPGVACNRCPAAEQCPEFAENSSCAYDEFFAGLPSRDIDNLLPSLESFADIQAERARRAVFLEKRITGGQLDPNVTRQIEVAAAAQERVAKLKGAFEQGVKKSVTVIAQGNTGGHVGGGILSKLLAGYGPTRSEGGELALNEPQSPVITVTATAEPVETEVLKND